MPSPFDNLFNPSNPSGSAFGNMMGTIGAAMGVPTDQQRTGDAQGQAMAELSALMQQEGGNAQRAFMKFVQTPTGQNLFVNDPNALTTLAGSLKQMQTPAPTITNIPAGGTMVQTDQSGKVVGQVSQPDTAMQTFNELAKIANLDDQTKRQIAAINMLPKGSENAKQNALNALVTAGKMSPEMAQKITAGVFQPSPIYNEQGNIIGQGIYDLSTGRFVSDKRLDGIFGPGPNGQIPPPPGSGVGQSLPTQPGAQPTPSAVPGPQTQEPNGITPLQQGDETVLRDPKASMALSAGVLPVINSTIGGIAGQISPSLQQGMDKNLDTRMMQQRQNQVQMLRASMAELAKQGSGMNIPARLLNTVMDMTEFGTLKNPTVGPREANDKLINLRTMLDQEMQSEEQTLRDVGRLPQATRQQAAQRLQAYQRISRAIPTLPELNRVGAMISAGTAGAMLPQQTLDAAKTVEQGTMNGQGPDFSKMDANQITKINPNTLNTIQLRAFRSRLMELKAQVKQNVKGK